LSFMSGSKADSIFQFKQFSVDQTNCAMKINTDGVLLGAMADTDNPLNILDIGTGTGVIALMLTQRFLNASINALEIDEAAAQTANKNFKASPFAERLSVYAISFESYFTTYPDRKYDLIVSNPPFYIDSLKSPGEKKTLAKHTDVDFFERLIKAVAEHLTSNGYCWLVLPVNIAGIVVTLAKRFKLHPAKVIGVLSYAGSVPHRNILCLGFDEKISEKEKFIIYEEKDVYSDEYKKLLQAYFLAF
jgi:tRNA1Val (adenine37-N6)-methyltransferase